MPKPEPTPRPLRTLPERAFRARARLVAVLMCCICFAGLAARLLYLQLFSGGWYTDRALGQQLRDTVVPADRGRIYSADGVLLAANSSCWTLRASPREMPADKLELAAKGLAEILELDEAKLLEKFSDRASNDCLLRYRVERDTADAVRDFCEANGITGIRINQDSKRWYPQGEFLASVLGFTNVDNAGVSGLELKYNDVLTGDNGVEVYADVLFDATVAPFDSSVTSEMQNALAEKYQGLLRDFVDKTKPVKLDAVSDDMQMPRPALLEEKGIMSDSYNQKVTMVSLTPDVLDFNGYHAMVYRPLPGEAAKDVTVTVTITDSDSGVSASRSFLIAVQPLTQQEIDAELALMAAVKAHYFDGIRNGNTDAKNILTDLHPFQEAYLDADGQLVWVYDHADLTGSGIVPVAMDGWTESEQWRLFRSTDPDVISHENLLVTRAAGDKTVTVSSELSSETLGKYAARYPDNKDFQALSCQPVSVELTVPGTEPVTPTPVDPTPVEPDHKALSVTFQLHTDTEMWIAPSVIDDLPEGTTAMDVFRQMLTANGYSYEAKGSYVQAVIKPDGTKVAEFSKGPNSGWVFRVNGEFPDVAMQDCRLSDGDVIEVFFTADYMDEPGMFLPFTDVTNHWAYSAIKRVYTRGLMVGMDEKTFAPDQQLSRAMLAVILYAMAGEPAVTGESPFTDVPAGCWYTDAIVWAAQNGIVCGFGDGTFRPNEAITRAQAAVMLYGYAAFTGADVTARADLSAYSDAGQIPAWAQAAMQWANARQLIVGRDSSHLVPDGKTTRAEMAAILSAYIGK